MVDVIQVEPGAHKLPFNVLIGLKCNGDDDDGDGDQCDFTHSTINITIKLNC